MCRVKLWEWSRCLTVRSPQYVAAISVKEGQNGRREIWFTADCCRLLYFSSSSPWPLPHSLCSFVLSFFSSTFPFHPCIFHFYLICSFIVYFLSRFSLLSLLCFFSNLSFSPIPSFFPPSSFSFFSLSLYVPSPVTIVDILPSSSVRLIYNNAIKIKKVNQMIFLF